ncbi:MAG TPA: cytochrome c [Thermohalobaculum sp.]|nr:cytochrome c [Thermohalobaculum sp.]
MLPPTAALTQDDPGEKAIKARQGFMQIVAWEAGPLFGMAKGDVEYDAEQAAANAENLDALLQYNVGRLFTPGTSKSDHPGKTRALAAIWEDMEGFASAYGQLRERVAVVAEEAGKGKDALTAAVSEMGKACGNCHDDNRAKEF